MMLASTQFHYPKSHAHAHIACSFVGLFHGEILHSTPIVSHPPTPPTTSDPMFPFFHLLEHFMSYSLTCFICLSYFPFV